MLRLDELLGDLDERHALGHPEQGQPPLLARIDKLGRHLADQRAGAEAERGRVGVTEPRRERARRNPVPIPDPGCQHDLAAAQVRSRVRHVARVNPPDLPVQIASDQQLQAELLARHELTDGERHLQRILKDLRDARVEEPPLRAVESYGI